MFFGKRTSLPNQCSPQPDIISCGMPSMKDMEKAASDGIKTVINLCSPSDTPAYELSRLKELGIRYANIPVTGPQDLTREKALALGEIINDCGQHPVLIHCMSGNRVGALMAMKAFHADGATPAAALDYGLKSGLGMLRGEVERLLREGAAARG